MGSVFTYFGRGKQDFHKIFIFVFSMTYLLIYKYIHIYTNIQILLYIQLSSTHSFMFIRLHFKSNPNYSKSKFWLGASSPSTCICLYLMSQPNPGGRHPAWTRAGKSSKQELGPFLPKWNFGETHPSKICKVPGRVLTHSISIFSIYFVFHAIVGNFFLFFKPTLCNSFWVS